MTFENFEGLVHQINSDLGSFCNGFQYKRKELLGRDKIAEKNKLFGNIKEDEGWAINKGGGVEIQYHIGFYVDSLTIRYGLGFNTQYVQFANEMSMVDYMRPFMTAFIQLEEKISKELIGYSFYYDGRVNLETPQKGKYTLFEYSGQCVQ